MTLSNRNGLFVCLTVFSIILIILIVVFNALSFYNGTLELFPEGKSTTPFYSKSFLLRYSPNSVIIACFLLLFYVPFISSVILVYFEKTNLHEISYFGIYLLMCLIEGLRIVVPLFTLWKDNSWIMIIISRLVFFSRVSSSIIMLSIALLNQDSHEHHAKHSNLFILLFISILTCVIPINSMQILSTCFYPYAYYSSFVFLRIFFIALTVFTYYMISVKYGITEYKKSALYMLMIMTGQFFLQEGDSVLYITTGGFLFYFGTYLYLKNIHHYYLWK